MLEPRRILTKENTARHKVCYGAQIFFLTYSIENNLMLSHGVLQAL